jgi:hypothetical protein
MHPQNHTKTTHLDCESAVYALDAIHDVNALVDADDVCHSAGVPQKALPTGHI